MALMTLEFKLNGGKIVFLTYQEAELLYKDLERVFSKPITYPPPVLTYPPGVRDFDNDPRKIPKPYQPGTWCGSNPEVAKAHTGIEPGCYGGLETAYDQKEALAEIKLRGEAH